MTTLHKYTFTCITESTEKSVWRDEDDTAPSKCPDDTSHTIDTTSIRITDTVEETVTTIREEVIPTGGHFRAMCKSIDISANETKIDDNIWPYNISALAIEFITDTENQGDELELIVGPDTIIGNITSDVSINDTVINVNDTVIDYIDVGFRMNLFDGVNTEELGHVISIDKDNKTITTENSSTTAFLATSPTYVRMNVNVINNYVIGKPGRWMIGEAKIGGSHVKAGISVRIIYKNNTASAKNFTAQLEYLY